MTEAELQAQVVDLAGMTGWRAMHVRRSVGRRGGAPAWQTATSVKGWPDLFLWNVRSGRVLVVELKSDDGRVRPEQQVVLDELAACGLDVRVWRPADWPEIEATLTRRNEA